MEDLRERIAYLQGLTEGLKFEEGRDEAKIIKQMVDILGDLVDEVEELRVAQEDLEDYMESLDEDLYGDEDGLEEEHPQAGTSEGEAVAREDAGNEDIEYMEVECPKCHDIICFDADIVDEEDIIEVTCPNCDQIVYINDGSMPPPARSGKAGRAEPEADQPEDEDI